MKTLSEFSLLPSVIGCDLCNLEREVNRLEQAGYRALHMDVLDGHYSPSLPIGLDTYKQLATRTSLAFDVHIMSTNNMFFVQECIKMKPRRICFQVEGERHITKLLDMIKDAGIMAGLAFAPATDIRCVAPALEVCDYILLMRIEPGYASFSNRESTQMRKKIKSTRQLLDEIRPGIGLTIDGRVSFADAAGLVESGADSLVCGSKSAFASPDLKENFKKMVQALECRGYTDSSVAML